MMAMMTGPPEWSSLSAGSAEHRERKLDGSGRFECSMRKIPMIPAGNREHPNEIECDRDRHGDPACSHPDDT